MSLIKYPSQITPSRLTPQLVRSDELFMSPATGIQQTASRGNAYWRWTLEYNDLSDSERDTVQAFLMKCKGSLNHFKIPDFGNYEIRGTVSDWIDVYSNYGTFNVSAGSDTVSINSWFSSNFDKHIEDEQVLRLAWKTRTSQSSVRWKGHGASSHVRSLEAGKAYIQRVKHWQNPSKVAHSMSFRVGSGSNSYMMQSAPQTQVRSDAVVTMPFYAGNDVSSYAIDIVDWTEAGNVGNIGDYWKYADYRLARCALVSNSENLLTYSNNFSHGIWGKSTATNIVSGYGGASPTGVTSGAWKFYGTAVTSQFWLTNPYTKSMTQELYSVSVYARAVEKGELRLQIDNGGSTHVAYAIFWLNSGTYSNITNAGSFYRATAEMFDVGSSWYRCKVSAVTDSGATVRYVTYLNSGTGNTWTNNGSEGIEIFGAQLRKHPFAGHYVPTTDTVIPGSGWQTGSNLYVDGLDARDIIKAGTRIEVVTQFYNVILGHYEKSEFKRVTEEVLASNEGWAIIPIDPPIRNAPQTDRSWQQQTHLGETLHNPVIFSEPELKARLLGSTIQYVEKPLKLTDITFDIIEDLAE